LLGSGCRADAKRRHTQTVELRRQGSVEQPATESEDTVTSIPLSGQNEASDIQLHYSPEEDLSEIDAKLISSAREEISMSAFSFTDRTVLAALEDRAAHGVKIRIYRDHGSTKEELDQPRAGAAPVTQMVLDGAEVRIKGSSVLAHLKAYEVDGRILRTGSANFSPSGEDRQDNDLVIIASPAAATSFRTKFDQMWRRPDNEILQVTR
jgi:phosphatidylserine/phosphatidylglycerophosphate/cardiolipin synthase-like enzyme